MIITALFTWHVYPYTMTWWGFVAHYLQQILFVKRLCVGLVYAYHAWGPCKFLWQHKHDTKGDEWKRVVTDLIQKTIYCFTLWTPVEIIFLLTMKEQYIPVPHDLLDCMYRLYKSEGAFSVHGIRHCMFETEQTHEYIVLCCVALTCLAHLHVKAILYMSPSSVQGVPPPPSRSSSTDATVKASSRKAKRDRARTRSPSRASSCSSPTSSSSAPSSRKRSKSRPRTSPRKSPRTNTQS